MGRALAARYPVFARAVDAATEAVVRAGGRRVWTPRHGFARSLETADSVQPTLFVYQLALAELVQAWGIHAHAVAGHGAGEIAAAVVAGALSLSDGARVAATRGHTLSRLDDPGAAAVLRATPADVRRLVEPMRSAVSLATVDGPDSVVVTGVPRYVEALVRRARRRGWSAELNAVADLSHVPAMREALPEFTSQLRDVTPRAPGIPVYSTVRRSAVITTPTLGADYWTENISGTVELASALAAAADDGMSTVVEIAPHPTLTPVVRAHPAFATTTYPLVVADNEAESFLEAVARLYADGRMSSTTAENPSRHGRFPSPPTTEHTHAPPPQTAAEENSDGVGLRDSDGDGIPLGPTVKAESTQATTGYEWLIADQGVVGDGNGQPWPTRGAAVYDPTVATATEWAATIVNEEYWEAVDIAETTTAPVNLPFHQALVVGESAAAAELEQQLSRRLPSLRIRRDPVDAGPIAASLLADQGVPTAVVLVWPAPELPGPVTTGVAGALDLLRRLLDSTVVATLTVVLTDRTSPTQHAIAGLVRTLQLESAIPTRLIWTADGAPERLVGLVLETVGPQELLVRGYTVTARRFRPATASGTPITIRPEGTYVVTGGLGALGSVAARWLLDAGARDLVVLTRTPRPLPQLLDGSDDRIVVVRCDVTDRADLANALFDIRACGSTIRGAVHAAGLRRDAEFGAVTTSSLAELFEPRAGGARHLIDLTAADPLDFVLLSSSATGALGSPGQAADAAAHAALNALAHNRTDDRVRSIDWGAWISGPAPATAHWRRAGVTPFDVARGTAVLSVALGHRAPSLLAVDYTPTDDPSPLATRLRALLPHRDHGPPPNPDTGPLPKHPTIAALSAALAEGFPTARQRDST
ncbi:SDR family NAD(P)-dependent oxidoreductase [Nocardia blacklockiae]|nr:SDR family NAD(P)-dependent oxidoreductase [Nocardia blacklockiae]